MHTHVSFANPCVHHVRDNPSACVFLGSSVAVLQLYTRSNGSPEKHTRGEECVRVLGFLSVGAAKSSVQTCPSSRTKGLGRSAPMGLLFECYKYPRGFPERVGALSSLQLYTRSNGSPEKHTRGEEERSASSELTSDRTSDCVASLPRHPELGSGPGSHSAKSRQLGPRLQALSPPPPLGPELLQ